MGLDAIRSDPAAALLRLPLKISHLVALETVSYGISRASVSGLVLWSFFCSCFLPMLPT